MSKYRAAESTCVVKRGQDLVRLGEKLGRASFLLRKDATGTDCDGV